VKCVLALLISTVTLAINAQVPPAPRLGGEWKLDAEQSSPRPPNWITMVLKVVQTETGVVFERQVVQADPQAPRDARLPKTEVLRFQIGLPTMNADDVGQIRATARWDNGALVVDGAHDDDGESKHLPRRSDDAKPQHPGLG